MEKTTLQKAESFVCGNFNVKLELDESLAELAEKVRVVLLNGATQNPSTQACERMGEKSRRAIANGQRRASPAMTSSFPRSSLKAWRISLIMQSRESP